ncbi:hypothetical protein ECP_1856 [Escherichia coli 536]|uniref:Uncharacterized protein n=1 Tax=Escherichia coli O6:K15:H31 (strain 536 / UPEC) TaxID=362663 RepID=A0A454A4W1_ECOL5|nr:hypothetical protein ECP_1856 [Escherichia coli 536]
MPDALRLSGLQVELQFIEFAHFVGRVRRLRRIRQHKAQFVSNVHPRQRRGFFCPQFTGNPQITPHFTH